MNEYEVDYEEDYEIENNLDSTAYEDAEFDSAGLIIGYTNPVKIGQLRSDHGMGFENHTTSPMEGYANEGGGQYGSISLDNNGFIAGECPLAECGGYVAPASEMGSNYWERAKR